MIFDQKLIQLNNKENYHKSYVFFDWFILFIFDIGLCLIFQWYLKNCLEEFRL